MQENTEPAGEIRFFGIGRDARIAAMRTAEDLRSRGVAAAAPQHGGWIVRIYPCGIRKRA